MKREQDYVMLLLGMVTLLSLAITGVSSLLEPAPATASKPATQVADQVPARVIVPFTPNTTPSER